MARMYPETTKSSLVGLAINYTLLVPIYLNWVVKLISDMETYIGSVERIWSYIDDQQGCQVKDEPSESDQNVSMQQLHEKCELK